MPFEGAICCRFRCRTAAQMRWLQPSGQIDPGVIDRFHDHHSSGASIAQCIMMLVADPEEAGEYVEAMAGEIGPSALGHPHAVEPRRFDHLAPMHAACGGERSLVKKGVRDGGPTGKMAIDDCVDVRKGGLPNDVIATDAVDPRVERRELIARIYEALVRENLQTIPKADDPDLADAANTGSVMI